MLKIETDRLLLGLNMTDADVLEIRISTHARKGQISQTELFESRLLSANENEIPIEDDTVAAK